MVTREDLQEQLDSLLTTRVERIPCFWDGDWRVQRNVYYYKMPLVVTVDRLERNGMYAMLETPIRYKATFWLNITPPRGYNLADSFMEPGHPHVVRQLGRASLGVCLTFGRALPTGIAEVRGRQQLKEMLEQALRTINYDSLLNRAHWYRPLTRFLPNKVDFGSFNWKLIAGHFGVKTEAQLAMEAAERERVAAQVAERDALLATDDTEESEDGE